MQCDPAHAYPFYVRVLPLAEGYFAGHVGLDLDVWIWSTRSDSNPDHYVARCRSIRGPVDEAIIFTDDWMAYKPLSREYAGHSVINHSAGVYVRGNIHTNTIEGFFGNLKTGMRGTYKQVSRKWLQSYLDEYAWRYNQRPRASRHVLRPARQRGRSPPTRIAQEAGLSRQGVYDLLAERPSS